MKLNQSSIRLIEQAIREAISKFSNDSNGSAVTDIHLQPDAKSGLLAIYDDEDNELATAHIEEWENADDEHFYSEAEQILSTLLEKLKDEAAFNALTILKPYSFVLVDEEKETISELLLMDDDTLLLSNELLKGLDEELDAFLKELLEK